MNFATKITTVMTLVFGLAACGVDDSSVSETNDAVFGSKDKAVVINKVATKPLNGGVTGEYRAIKILATVEVATNDCTEINAGKIRLVKSVVKGDIVITAIQAQKVHKKEILCTMNYDPVYKVIPLEVQYHIDQTIIIKNLKRLDQDFVLRNTAL